MMLELFKELDLSRQELKISQIIEFIEIEINYYLNYPVVDLLEDVKLETMIHVMSKEQNFSIEELNQFDEINELITSVEMS